MPLAANKNRNSLFPPSSGVAWAAVLTAGMLVLQALPGPWLEQLRYERAAVEGGQWWRLLTANFVHLGWAHLALNACALLVMGVLFGRERSGRAWIIPLAICSALSSLGLYLFSPEIHWVVGLSGVLHGLFVVGAIGWIAQGESLGWWLLLGVVLKITWEQWFGEIPLSADIVGGAVVTEAHLWGAVGGLLAVCTEYVWRRFRSRL